MFNLLSCPVFFLGPFNFFYFKSFLDFVTISALAQIINVLLNCLETECNFLVLRVGSKLILWKTAEDMDEEKRIREES